MMVNHWKKPGRVWLLPVESDGEHQRIEGCFNYHEDTGFEPDLEWLTRTLGCDMIELRQLRLGHLWCDEEGKLKPVPESRLNPVATTLHHQAGYRGFIVGTAVLVVDPEFPQNTVERLMREAAVLWADWRSATARVQA